MLRAAREIGRSVPLIEYVTIGATDVLEQTLPVEFVVRGSTGPLKKRRGT